ncbi:hypothetical protein ERO13_D12G185750v2 [Gossypium hirsutum]|uniref:Uncharacterized protein n=3 Tax=Gossypium TaxID=3633 RepID=A0A5J5N8A2_GOSBA|nr:hypothetical protein ES319_1Z064000v1 [Gossypium barbadense]KAB2000083.1 hypothetical protein ES319_D12G206500v1 [Gossypium barbadense]KAG4116719.1 hypothetical protein ERO13_D12G185750v2 [Gossypium hirsutum]TYG92702.1 hypothetical protein ES288_A11G052600v1 [Gossypium darwinii]TYI51920.1 hypothetical protein E1A91_D12G209300v1 [Gossypium mustelinum]
MSYGFKIVHDYKSCLFLLNYNDIGISATGFFCFFLLISEFLIHCLERVNLFSEGMLWVHLKMHEKGTDEIPVNSW